MGDPNNDLIEFQDEWPKNSQSCLNQLSKLLHKFNMDRKYCSGSDDESVLSGYQKSFTRKNSNSSFADAHILRKSAA